MRLSPSQLRAARALLNWSRADLAQKTGISEQTIHRFENSSNVPTGKTSSLLLRIFDKHGIEFSENNGVRTKPNNIRIYEGIDGFNDFFELFYSQLETTGGDSCLNIYDESSLSKCRKDREGHRKRMKSIIDKGRATFRILTTKSDFHTYGYAQFRWQPQQIPIPTGFSVFGDYLALISLVDETSPHIVVVHSAPIAEGHRQSFNLAWENADPPPNRKT